MTGQAANSTQGSFTWGHTALVAEFATAHDGTLRMTRLAGPDGAPVTPASSPESSLPLVEVTALGHGTGWSGQRFTDSALGSRLRYRSHRAVREGDWHRLHIELHDPGCGLTAEVRLSSLMAWPSCVLRYAYGTRGSIRWSSSPSAVSCSAASPPPMRWTSTGRATTGSPNAVGTGHRYGTPSPG